MRRQPSTRDIEKITNNPTWLHMQKVMHAAEASAWLAAESERQRKEGVVRDGEDEDGEGRYQRAGEV